MKIAIDIDGTLTAWPRQMLWLASVWKKWIDDEVIFLTGHAHPDPATVDRPALLRARRAQLMTIGDSIAVNGDYPIHVCIGKNSAEVAQQKAEFCRDNHIDMFIDDSADYCRAVRTTSPTTMILWVHP